MHFRHIGPFSMIKQDCDVIKIKTAHITNIINSSLIPKLDFPGLIFQSIISAPIGPTRTFPLVELSLFDSKILLMFAILVEIFDELFIENSPIGWFFWIISRLSGVGTALDIQDLDLALLISDFTFSCDSDDSWMIFDLWVWLSMTSFLPLFSPFT